MLTQSETEERLVKYLKETRPNVEWPRRVFCCGSSRSLYCPECCKILIPKQDYPDAIIEGRLQLPFDLDIILDMKERKTSSTGVQLMAVANALESRSTGIKMKSVILHDLAKVKLPKYDPTEPGVFVLFPDKDSVPISTVSPSKLVVLDIKWTRQSLKEHPHIASLPKVHLNAPPAHSHFWRWHSAGNGMLSTIEAVFFAAMEATEASWNAAERDDLIHLMWIFALQRSVITEKSEEEDRILPFSKESKAAHRALRSQQGGNLSKRKSQPDFKSESLK